MSLREITETSIEQACDACGRVRSIPLSDLCIGQVTENYPNPGVIPMPECDRCQAVEYLIPGNDDAPEHPSPGSFGHRHAMLVEVLHERLAQSGRAAEGLAIDRLKKRKPSREELNRWFKYGLKLSSPVESILNAESSRKS